jgi:two-component system cell cycle sensor histidine kinase/response regulator CckA
MGAPTAHVLVVDDDPPTCLLIADVLRRNGYRVTIAHSGADAIRLCEDNRFDLATVDVVMPVMSGDETARQLRASHPTLKILFVTGYPEALFQAQPMLWEDEAFLEKPCTDRGLVEAVSLLLTGRLPQPASSSRVQIADRLDDREPLI